MHGFKFETHFESGEESLYVGRARVWQRFLKHTQKQAVSQSQGQRNAAVWALRQGRPGGRKR